MKKVLFFAAAAVIGFSSCTKDSDGPVPEPKKGAIEFRSLTDKNQSRASITDGSNILSFTVTAWWDKNASNSYGSDDSNKGSYVFNGFDITRGEKTAANEWTYSPVKYWPATGTVDFFAYSPASSRNLSKGLKDLGENSNLITYEVPAVASNNPQEDFMVAVAKDKTSGTVLLNFQHALSRVLFNASKIVEDVDYTIDGIELVNVKAKGNLDLTTATIPENDGFSYAAATPIVNWTNQAFAIDPLDDVTEIKNFTVDLSKSPIAVKYDAYTPVIGMSNALMVMPQATDLGVVYDATTAPNHGEIGEPDVTADPLNAGKFYIKVSYKAFQSDGFYYAGSAAIPSPDGGVTPEVPAKSKELYIPVEDPFRSGEGLTFEMGRQYTFNLTFGNELSIDPNTGKPYEIGFDVEVKNWNIVDPI